MTPRLSVVVPFFDVAEYISDCLESLRRQTLRELEVIVVDDGSRDGSAGIAERFCAADPRFRLVRQQNQGLGPARNTGAREAAGEYLTFVDSDDVVPAHAYEALVGSLDRTGSSLAAGGARRFDGSFGVWESWLHRVPFARDRRACHVLDFPALALDRMVWNKVFRRSFWEEFGYAFPAIRYEDYPVTLRAHLDAVTVDCLAAPVYYWRERDGGGSITQRRYEYANLRDRVVSAELVLDVVDAQAPELRPPVHRHFAQIDLVTLVEAFGAADGPDTAELAALGRRLADRLDSRVVATMAPLDRLHHHALRAGDVELLRRLALFRESADPARAPRAARRPVVPWAYELRYPELGGPRRLARLTARSLYLYTTVTEVDWRDGELVVSGTAEIRHLRMDERAAVRVTLLSGQDPGTPLPVERSVAVDSHGERSDCGFTVRIPGPVLARITPGRAAHLAVEVTHGRVHRRGVLRHLRAGNAEAAAGAWVSGTGWLQPYAAPDGRLLLRHERDPGRLTSASIRDGQLVLAGRLPPDAGTRLHLTGRWGGPRPLPCEVRPAAGGTAFTVRLPLARLHAGREPDDPVTGLTVWPVQITASGRPLLATGLHETVGCLHDGRLYTVGRGAEGRAVLAERPPRLLADEAALRDDRTVAAGGRLWVPADGMTLVWRGTGPSRGTPDLPCTVSTGAGRWTATLAWRDLLGAGDGGGSGEWTLFTQPADGMAYPVVADGFLAGRSAVTLRAGRVELVLRPLADRLRVEVHDGGAGGRTP
ncbi:glycosyltransferase family 2 protein [Catellatospora sp. NPDC049609]|uniref:glycosyltransferase family 2 protein n=1 Tax=Catellatospora sp. NPDC049609 TaxID=3155505 RepID=UPI00341EF23A